MVVPNETVLCLSKAIVSQDTGFGNEANVNSSHGGGFPMGLRIQAAVSLVINTTRKIVPSATLF